jgi:hypothetical protein
MERRKAEYSSTLNDSPKRMCRMATPAGLARYAMDVSLIWGSAMTGNGMNIAASR